MKTITLKSKHGYDIPCRSAWDGQERVVIACHGFGSSKDSPMIQALMETFPPAGLGVVSFDFPAHGDSPIGQEGLRVPYCIGDLAAVEAQIRAQAPGVSLGYFGSSFGAYITLLYLAQAEEHGPRAFLRSAAVAMPELVESWVDQRAREDLARQGYFVPDYDYVREIRVTPAFLQDLEAHDVFRRCQPGTVRLCMVHGGRDAAAPLAHAQAFAREKQAELTVLPEGEHNLMGPGELEKVLRLSQAFSLAP